jgi:AcrR family transcriptional regulator
LVGNRRPTTISDHKQQAVQREIRRCAFELFVNQGFESTTVEQIAEAAGISRRTYFRYFETKEDVVIVALHIGGETLEEMVRARPMDEDAWTAARRSLADLLVHFQIMSERSWEILNLIQSTPRLRARFLLERESWISRISAVLLERGTPEKDAAIISNVAGGILAYTYERWHEDPNIDPGMVIHEAYEALGRQFLNAKPDAE